MNPNNPRFESEMLPVWTGKSDSTPFFVPLTEALQTVDFQSVCWQYWLGSSAGNLEVQPWVQFSHDLQTWVDGVYLTASDTWNSTAGWAYATTYLGISGNNDTSRRYVRFGMKVRNTSGNSNLSYARVQLRIQARS
jgi:hypothetical protein